MSKLIEFPHIAQFRNIVKDVRYKTTFVGKDEEGNAIHDHSIPFPTFLFSGTVKLHGTNSSVCQENGERWFQSRTRIITSLDDNYGFAFWAETNKEKFDVIFSLFNPDAECCVFGEWCGNGIQKSVAISELPKMFVVFGIRINGGWLSEEEVKQSCEDSGLISIYQFETYHIWIDFSQPELAQNDLCKITEAVENECPVGKSFGISGIGEGVVWTCENKKYGHLQFKVKGEKHSVSKVKTLASVDVEKVNSAKECAEKICTENRMLQGIEKLKEQGLQLDVKNLGVFLKWLCSDCVKEELDTISQSGLAPKDVCKIISNIGRSWFFLKLNCEALK